MFYRDTSLSCKWCKIIVVALCNERIPKLKHNGKYWSDFREDIEPICKEIKDLSRICRRLWNDSIYRHPDFRHIQWNSRVSRGELEVWKNLKKCKKNLYFKNSIMYKIA